MLCDQMSVQAVPLNWVGPYVGLYDWQSALNLHYAVGKVLWPGTWVGASFKCIPQFGGAGDYSSIGEVVVWTLCLGGAVGYATGRQAVSPYGFLLVWGHILCSTVR